MSEELEGPSMTDKAEAFASCEDADLRSRLESVSNFVFVLSDRGASSLHAAMRFASYRLFQSPSDRIVHAMRPVRGVVTAALQQLITTAPLVERYPDSVFRVRTDNTLVIYFGKSLSAGAFLAAFDVRLIPVCKGFRLNVLRVGARTLQKKSEFTPLSIADAEYQRLLRHRISSHALRSVQGLGVPGVARTGSQVLLDEVPGCEVTLAPPMVCRQSGMDLRTS